MRTVVVRPGDHLAQIAHENGVDADEVWNDPRNQGLRDSGRSPELLHPGDVITLPDSEPRTLQIRKGQTNRYSARIPRLPTRVRLMGEDGPVANEPFEVVGVQREPVRGTSDGDGYAEFEVPVGVRLAELRLTGRNLTMTLGVGDLDPVTEPSGVRMRLSLLGLYSGPLTGDLDDIASRALLRFQRENGLTETGEPDQPTRDALVQKVGC